MLCKEVCTKSIENYGIKQFESHSQSANGLKRPFGVKNDKYGPCRGADFYKMIPCPGVGILRMIPCSAARSRTEKYMNTSPGLWRVLPAEVLLPFMNGDFLGDDLEVFGKAATLLLFAKSLLCCPADKRVPASQCTGTFIRLLFNIRSVRKDGQEDIKSFHNDRKLFWVIMRDQNLKFLPAYFKEILLPRVLCWHAPISDCRKIRVGFRRDRGGGRRLQILTVSIDPIENIDFG